jgi:hypothetical protein
MSINDIIIKIAADYLGEQEIRGNKGFLNKEFEEKMIATGWQKSQAWCAYFAELVWRESYASLNSLIENEVRELFSGSAVATFVNYKNAGWKINQNTNPAPGSLAIWQNYNKGVASWSGHAGIFANTVSFTHFHSIEGNTNDSGEREGYEVAGRKRRFNYHDKDGLVLLGFVEPKEI